MSLAHQLWWHALQSAHCKYFPFSEFFHSVTLFLSACALAASVPAVISSKEPLLAWFLGKVASLQRLATPRNWIEGRPCSVMRRTLPGFASTSRSPQKECWDGAWAFWSHRRTSKCLLLECLLANSGFGDFQVALKGLEFPHPFLKWFELFSYVQNHT